MSGSGGIPIHEPGDPNHFGFHFPHNWDLQERGKGINFQEKVTLQHLLQERRLLVSSCWESW